MSKSLDELDIHNKLMEKLTDAVDAMDGTTQSAVDAIENLSEHNADALAHYDIRQKISELEANGGSNVNEAISNHDLNPDAHKELITSINSKLEDVSRFKEEMMNVTKEHNESGVAHADIRAGISQINTRLGEIDLNTVESELARVKGLVDTTLPQQILDLQSVDAKHDSQIAKNKNDVAEIQSRLVVISEDIDTIASGDFIRQEDLDRLIINIKEVEIGLNLGFSKAADAPSFLKFNHTLPLYVGKNSTVKFRLKGATQHNGGKNVEYAVAVGDGDFNMSPTSGITEATDITLTTGSNGKPGDIRYMTVTCKDKDTNKVSKCILAFMVTRPIDLKYISIRNYVANAEPGYAFENLAIRNMACPKGCDRWTYTLQPLSSELIFTKTGGAVGTVSDPITVGTEEQFKLTVPSHLNRGNKVTFKITVHDKYGNDQDKSVDLTINNLPGAESFKHSVPQYVVPGKSYDVKFSGIASISGVPATYKITEENSSLTFSKKEGILANENVKITVNKSAPRANRLTFKVVSKDENNVEITNELTMSVNQLPSAADVITTLPKDTVGGKTIEFTISGGTDEEYTDKVDYFIDPLESGLIFSQTAGINEKKISVTIPKVATQTSKVFNIYAVDALGEKSSDPKPVSITVKPIYVADTPAILVPSDGAEVNERFVMKWTDYSQSIDV